MGAITYSLYKTVDNSDQYYKKIKKFAALVDNNINTMAAKYIDDYITYLKNKNIEVFRSRKIYRLEFLMIGIYWNIYINNAVKFNGFVGRILEKLASLRQKKELKGSVDFFRGILITAFLLKDKAYKHSFKYSVDNFRSLIDWLRASGEFDLEVDRFNEWLNFLTSLPQKEAEELLQNGAQLGFWFENESKEALGVFTLNVDKFIKENRKKMKWRENRLFCSRYRVEYHLNMVGAEMMNEGFREDFLKTKEKRVLLPVCMRSKAGKGCKAQKAQNDYKCVSCSDKCIVKEITALGAIYNFEVFIIPHASQAFTVECEKKGQIGIIGIACVLQLISGGYKAKAFGLEPQCVLLDYCGCKKHWHEEGLATRINLNKLIEILEG